MMFKDLSQGIKVSISRSITTSFEQYMSRIDWNESEFNMENFVAEWRNYIINHSSWYSQVSDELKADARFHEELADKINVTLDKILSEKPSAAQIEELNSLQQELKEEATYSCKMEAKYAIEKLKEKLKKQNS